MLKISSAIIALGFGIVMSGNAIAAPQGLQSTIGDRGPIQLAANSFAGTGGPSKKKICTTTYHPGGLRCTFCYYTTQTGSGSTVCIKPRTTNQNSGPAANKKLRF